MTSVSERTFGARLLHAQDILAYMTNFANYAPPEAQQTVNGFGSLLADIGEANMLESELKQQYKAAVQNRQSAFWESDNSLLKLVTHIKAAVEAQYGKTSQAYANVNAIITQMRPTKPSQTSPAPDSEPQDGISQSERSFGSLTNHFNQLIGTLNQLNGYNPSNPALQLTALETFATTLNTLNTAVADKYQQLHQQRNERLQLYDDLNARVQKIKAYVKAQYGQESSEYTLIKGVEV